MKTIFLFLFVQGSAGLALSGPKKIETCAGETLHIRCSYHRFYRDNVKYWCKGHYWDWCTILVRTEPRSSGRVEMSDDKSSGVFTVHISSVTLQQGGWYWCAIERVSRHVCFAIELKIHPAGSQECHHLTGKDYNATPTMAKQTGSRLMSTSPSPRATSTTSQMTVSSSSSPPSSTSTTTTTSSTNTPFFASHCEKTEDIPNFSVSLSGEQERLLWKVWRAMRWIVFFGLSAFLLCFTLYMHMHSARP